MKHRLLMPAGPGVPRAWYCPWCDRDYVLMIDTEQRQCTRRTLAGVLRLAVALRRQRAARRRWLAYARSRGLSV